MKKLLIIILLLWTQYAYSEEFIELRIPNKPGEHVTASLPNNESLTLGQVLMTPARTNWPAYTASKWAAPSTVCASAVNAIHILIDTHDGRGRIISLVPSITVAPAAAQGAFFSLEIPAGTGLFGAFAPLTGSNVTAEIDGQELPLTHELIPDFDALIIRTPLTGKSGVFMTDIENRPAGRVTVHDSHGSRVIARVVRPIGGVGRFGGTLYQNVGRIRASHSGVIDVSTSRRGETGGIQIMPLKHALTSKEMINAWHLSQWMILAPLPGRPDLEGTPPLFKDSLLPGAQLGDKLPDLWSHYGRRPLVLCRRNGGAWEWLPNVSGKIDDALRDVTHLRIYFPVWNEPLN